MSKKILKENKYIPMTSAEKRKKFVLLLIGLIGFNLFVWIALYMAVSKQNPVNKFINLKSSIINQSPSPTPFPFQEMTIPALRAREYKSKLGSLKEYAENESYTTYLTSYNSDGNKINGLLAVPKVSEGEKRVGGFPGIVFLHGYIPPSTYITTEKYGDYVDYLARSGIVVFKIDLRGHGESEGTARGGYFSPDYVIDTLNAREALQGSDFIKTPNNVGLWGHSMAGNVISRAIAVRPEIPVAVIWGGAVYSYSDMQKYGIDDNSYRPPADITRTRSWRTELFEKYGQFDPNNSFWKKVPMTNYLKNIKTAISLNHAVDDEVVNIGYSRDLNALLDKTKIPHELNEYPNGGHNISGASFDLAMQNTVAFYDKYLK